MTQKLVIPEELAPIFDRYRGTGRFTIGAVMEYVRRHNTIKSAKSMNILEWLQYAIQLSREKGLLENVDYNKYVNDNAEYWIDVWNDARNGYVLFDHKYSTEFEKEGLLKTFKQDAACFNDKTGNRIELDLVEFPKEDTNGIQLQQEQES